MTNNMRTRIGKTRAYHPKFGYLRTIKNPSAPIDKKAVVAETLGGFEATESKTNKDVAGKFKTSDEALERLSDKYQEVEYLP